MVDASGIVLHRKVGAGRRRADSPRQEAVGAVLDLDLIEPSPAEKALQDRRGRQ
jgi:hypothetical protein